MSEEFEGVKLFDDKLIFAVNFDKEKQVEDLKEKQNTLSSEYIKLHQDNKLTNIRKEEIKVELKKINNQIKSLNQSGKKAHDDTGLFDVFSNAKKKADELKRLHKEFFETTQKKDDLKKQIEKLEWDLIEATLKEQGKNSELKKLEEFKKTNTKPFFLWKLHFADVFEEKGGFDVVIANPPYIKEDVNRHAFDGLRKSDCYQGKMDIWYLFGSEGLDILRNHGVMTFIATNNWVTNDGASKFRNKIIKYGRIIDFIDFGDYKIFSAGIQTMVFVVLKDNESPEYDLKYAKLLDNNADGTLLTSFLNEPHELLNHRFEKFKVSIRRSSYLEGYIKFIHPTIGRILDRIKSAGCFNLMDHEIFSGIDVMQDFVAKSHLEKLNGKIGVGDGVFVLSEIEKTRIKWSNKELNLIKPYYTTREIARYYANKSNRHWIVYTGADANDKISLYPNIKKHLDKFKKIITSVNKPYGLHRTRDEENFLGQKIFSIRKCAIPSFSLVNFPCYVSRAFLIIKTNRIDFKYLLAILNSKVTVFWLLHKGKLQGNQFQVDKVPLMDIPIVCGQPSNQKPIIDLADKILSLAQDNKQTQDKIKEYERQIDQMVYALYGLTDEEIKIVEESVGK
ncbi:MAG: Eco57I restriction-modification methylase domain-containing protein [Candidatus Omnitrophota bacterium]|nr:Eco57I restriction-modification methylase domain-containing protein [Candidatus Omnitrophota bacterium]